MSLTLNGNIITGTPRELKIVKQAFKQFLEAEIERTKKIQNDTGYIERDLRDYLADEIKRYEEVINNLK